MWTMFNQYVKTRTQDNFKFWIVSFCCVCAVIVLFVPRSFRQELVVIIFGSLSKGVFERRTATGNETFSLFTRLGATTFVIPSVVTRIETIYLKIKVHPLPKNEKRPLPVAVRRSKTPLLKLPYNSPGGGGGGGGTAIYKPYEYVPLS